MLRAIKLAILGTSSRRFPSCGRHASAMSLLQALFSLYGISEISDDESLPSRWFRRASRRRVTVLYIKSLLGKSYGPRAGFLARIQRGGTILHSLHNAPEHGGVSTRLHFETLSKLGNCIKSDLYLSVPGILAPRARCDVTNFARLDER